VVQHTAALARYVTHALMPNGGTLVFFGGRASWANGWARSHRRVIRRYGEKHA
jgi:hypothetical protein